MSAESELYGLLARWDELRRQGQDVSLAELCAEEKFELSPDVIEEIERRVYEQGLMERLLCSAPVAAEAVSKEDPTMHREDTLPRGLDSTRTLPTVDEVIFSVSQYDYFKFLAKGGVGEIYSADDKDLGRDVALKFIQRDQEQHPESKSQFLVEGEVTARLEHPGVVPVYGFGYTSDGRPFHVMRLIRGTTLGDEIDRYHGEAPSLKSSERRVRFLELLTRFNSVCNTIAYSHNRGILHRDIKPENVMLGKYGETLVVDWGLAHPIPRSDAARHSGEATLTPGSGKIDDDELRYATGVVGTPCYMSPEQAEGKKELTAATDIYSLGATLYRLLTGETAIQGSHVGEIIAKAKAGIFRRPREVNPKVSRPLEAICLKAMSKEPEDRYETPLEIAEDIERWLADEKVSVYPETLPRRIARWTRRHRTATQLIVVSLALLVCIATFMTVWLGKSYRRESDALAKELITSRENKKLAEREASASKNTLRTTAYAVAQNVLNNLEYRRSVLERVARDPRLVGLVKDWNAARVAHDEQRKQNSMQELRTWLNAEFDSELPAPPDELATSVTDQDQFGNWFVNDRIGTQIARASIDKLDSGQLTVGSNYAWRSYFNGSNKDSKEDVIRLIDKQLRDQGTQELIEPLQGGPHLGAVYRADKFRVLKIPLSMPIRDPESRQVIGVLGMATDIGHFPQLHDLDVFVIDLRENDLNGTFRGLLLQHPRLQEYLPDSDTDLSNFEFKRIKDPHVLEIISGAHPLAQLDEIGTGLIDDIPNPLTGQIHDVAAFCPVQLSPRWKTSSELNDAPCWSVVVFKKTAEEAE